MATPLAEIEQQLDYLIELYKELERDASNRLSAYTAENYSGKVSGLVMARNIVQSTRCKIGEPP